MQGVKAAGMNNEVGLTDDVDEVQVINTLRGGDSLSLRISGYEARARKEN